MDPYLWLEEVDSTRALDHVRGLNESTTAALAGDRFDRTRDEILQILDSDERIPTVSRRGEWLWNYWRDAAHPYGMWRRTTLESYRTAAPDWDVVIDLDALRAEEGENWVWHGPGVLRGKSPDGVPWDRVLVSLSRGGSDATVIREFSVSRREFIGPEDGGFYLPEAKSRISWIDADTVYVGTDFGPGSLTASGYPRIAKRWSRGTPLADAQTVFEGEPTDIAVGAGYDDTPGYERHFVSRSTDFYNSDDYLFDPGTGRLEPLDVPTDADWDVHHDRLLVSPKTPWEFETSGGGVTVPPGALVAFDFDEFRTGSREHTVVFTPDEHTSLVGTVWTKSYLLVQTLEDVRSVVRTLDPADWSAAWTAGLPELAEIGVAGVDPLVSDEVFLMASSFTLPPTLLHGEAGGSVEPIKAAPALFDADGVVAEQFFATSADGTRVPYFVVRRQGLAPQPTLLYGYGGFEHSLSPGYMGIAGKTWIERGGAYVLANIRGGGEYGPTWHTTAVKENRMRCYEDFAAVAEDLVRRGVCTRDQLGCNGGSNGGLLVGVMYTLYPQLFGAVVCQVPLLDMRRYHRLLAGASWVAEYGDPDDPEQWRYISEYSPYQNLPEGRGGHLPALLVTTSTKDDRVHPGHARKFVTALRDRGIDVDYYENIEGGHGGAADNKQAAFMSALAYEFLWRELGGGDCASHRAGAGEAGR
ncbi:MULTISPECIES: prolyl oligopeptidase family serine peptidase [unclassified Tsukamurella]|uniref:prolyl oligopeptidase family serine peptidase n=1 Tax=unclassified Tsukamurella TaxID=2633480 RepID=UPI0031BB016B